MTLGIGEGRGGGKKERGKEEKKRKGRIKKGEQKSRKKGAEKGRKERKTFFYALIQEKCSD